MYKLMSLFTAVVVVGWSSVAMAQQISYPLYGSVFVDAGENAVDHMVMAVAGMVDVAEDGAISGQGFLTYQEMDACAWAPPGIDNGDAPWCRIDGVTDGAFTISGKVLEQVHRHDEDNEFKDAVFAFADKYSSERLDYAPLRVQLQLTADAAPAEHLTFWGLSNNNVEQRTTGAGALGLLSSTLFDTPFELLTLNAGAESQLGEGPSYHVFAGSYQGGTPVASNGRLALVDFDPAFLPKKSDPAVYLGTWIKAPEHRELTQAELDAVAAYVDDSASADIRAEAAEDIEWQLIEQGRKESAFHKAVMDIIGPHLLRPGG